MSIMGKITAPALAALLLAAPAQAAPLHVTLDGTSLLVDGKPYLIKGASARDHLRELAVAGANSVRIYGEDEAFVLDRAQELGLTVTAGIWLEHPRRGFNYADAEAVARQKEAARRYVMRVKDHPALLIWGVGNELETEAEDNELIWPAINDIARMIKQIDPNHPTMAVIAEITPEKIARIRRLCPDIDILGVNAYGGAPTLPARLRAMGWDKPVILTEFGALGQWEAQKSPWGAPYEPSSSAKAEMMGKTLDAVGAAPAFLGAYAFRWGAKQEQTATWHGLLLASGERLGQADMLTYHWSGHWPANRAPTLRGLTLRQGDRLVPGQPFQAVATADDPEGDKLTYSWNIVAEATDLRKGGDAEAAPPTLATVISPSGSVPLTAPAEAGAYRLFVTVHDNRGSAATANLPFIVEAR